MKSFIDVVRSRFTGLVGGRAPSSSAAAAAETTSGVTPALLEFFPKGEAIVKKEDDVATRELLQRQVGGMRMTCFLATKQKCKHGFPQAVVRRPVDIKNTSINSGMLRLTCPHLIKLIDGIEGQGGVKQYNEHRIKLEEVQQNFAHVNEQWGLIKREAITPEEMSFIEEKLQEKTYDFLNSGIIGIRQSGTSDVKCLHAHVADELIRDDNLIGKQVLADIVASGNDPRGCDECWHQCHKNVPRDEAKWWYESIKNKSKLRTKRINRNLQPKRKKSAPNILHDEPQSSPVPCVPAKTLE